MTTGRLLYSLCMALAIGTAWALSRPSALPWRKRLAIVAGAVFGAGAGAKLPFVLLGESAWFGDGKTLLSGLAGGYVGVEVAKLLSGVREKTGDAFAVPLAAAVAVGRWGCFFNGCCSAPGHAVPLYESAFHAAMAVVLWRLERVEALRWQLLKLYIAAYCVFRFAMEFIRTEPRVALGLTAYQLGAAALAGMMALLWWLDERLKRRSGAEAARTAA